MVGNMSENFERAYQFSRQLMLKLEMQAAKTILTMEDMLMLTKTFAQAGMVPKTDDDVRRISDIGVAIKALTEGMANAGVQMRQELYAIIAGRQRATDQLAMMFKLRGMDIQRIIDDAKKEGKSMIVALSDALKPFAAMNEAMTKEYVTQVNQLNVVLGVLKRIGAEPTLMNMAKWLKEINESLFDFDRNQLTKKKGQTP